MKIQLIRNATLKISLGKRTILTDPMFSPRHGIESFAGKEKNPVKDLPMAAEQLIKDIDMVLVSHLHQDHFDEAAKQLLPRDIPLFCRPGHEESLKQSGFSQVFPFDTKIAWEGIEITPTPGRHAANLKWENILGPVCGFMLKADQAPLIYWAGDTILYDGIRDLIKTLKPDIILTHSCGACIQESGPIVMDGPMTMEICRLAPMARVIAIHMEALDHATVTRKELRALADKMGISARQLLIPEDGDILDF